MSFSKGAHFTPARAGTSRPIRLSRRSIRTLLYCLGFLGAVTILAKFGGPGSLSLYKPPKHPLGGGGGSIIDTNKVHPLTKPSSHITPFPSSFNPLSESTPLAPGPWTAHFPSIVAINQPFRLRIECNHEDTKYCPPNYHIQLYGPTAASVPITALSQVTPRTVEAAMVLHEQGNYQVYAWPNYPNCTDPHGDPSAHTQSVGATPHLLTAQRGPFPIGRDKHDVHRACRSYEEVLDGRWINHDLVESSMRSTYSYGESRPPQVSLADGRPLPDHSRYVYSPYDCKIPHRSFADVLDEAPGLRHVVFIGGPAARGYVCARALPDLFGNDGGASTAGMCEQPLSRATTTRTYTTREGRAVDVTFAPVGGRFPTGDALKRLLDRLEPPPQIVVFDVGDLAGAVSDGEFVEHHEAAFDYFDSRWKGAHVLVRTGASVVQPLQCAAGEEGEGEGHTRADAWGRRGLTLAAVSGWAARLKAARDARMDDLELEEVASTRVSFIDAYTITDLRPETSADGYRWVYPAAAAAARVGKGGLAERPTVGEAEDMVLDWMWDEIVARRSMTAL